MQYLSYSSNSDYFLAFSRSPRCPTALKGKAIVDPSRRSYIESIYFATSRADPLDIEYQLPFLSQTYKITDSS